MTDQHPVRIGTEAVTTTDPLVVRSPYDGRELWSVPRCGPEHVEAAVAAAREARRRPLEPWARAEVLDAAARLVIEQRDELALIIADEAAKPIGTARTEVERTALTFRSAAIEARTLAGEVVPLDGAEAGAGKFGFTLRIPRGVVAGISPFNFPSNLVAHKVAPAIAAGCPIVLKPASQTPRTALALQDLLVDGCGLPPGWLSVVTGSGGDVGDPLVTHADVAMVTFTGSPDVGWSIAEKAARKKVGLELGNNAPVILDASADWEQAVAKIAVAGYSHAGQSCISTQRVYVHHSLVDAFTDALASAVDALVVGDPRDEATDVSALIHPDEAQRVHDWIGEAVEAGARAVTGGDLDGRLLAPTVLADVTPDMAVSRDEVFGPVVGIAPFADLDEALALANDTRYGLQAAIFTRELDGALRAARGLDFGGVLVNEVPTFRTDQMPYGGVGDSGNTKEGPRWAVRDMTVERLVVIAG
jgi:acyl-CoA reductase-like NAD-dependent aldehyde dehydrogenase